MSDIVERLRRHKPYAGNSAIVGDVLEAAAEITRLRAELARVTALGEGLVRYASHYSMCRPHEPSETCFCELTAALSAWQGRGDGEG